MKWKNTLIILGLSIILCLMLVSCVNAVENKDINNTYNKYGMFGLIKIHFRDHDNIYLNAHIKLYDSKGHLVLDKTAYEGVEYWGKPFAKYTYECYFLPPYDKTVTGKIKWYQDDIFVRCPVW